MEKQDLRAGITVWESRSGPSLRAKPLVENIATDVLVVGAGVSGALVAEAVTSAGFSVAVLDRRGAAMGSTAASTSLLLFEIDTPLIKLSKMIPPLLAARAWRRSCASMENLIQKVRTLDIKCDFILRDALYLSGSELFGKGLQAEAKARRKIDLPSTYLDGETLRERYGIEREAAILSGNSAEADPVQLAAGFLNQALAGGAVLYAPEELKNILPNGEGVIAHTASRHRIEAHHVIFTTGYEVPDFIPKDSHKIISTWAIATPPQHDNLWHSHCLIWEAADPYIYLRTMPDGRIVMGGEDEESSDAERRNALIPAKARALQNKLRELFPEVDPEAEFAWAGAFGKSPTGLPTIGPLPGWPSCYAVLGFGGNGMTYAQIAAEMTVSWLSGNNDTDADLFAFGAVNSTTE
jgi:glycine/D-amino acid oxidase-like deaminating enzyme